MKFRGWILEMIWPGNTKIGIPQTLGGQVITVPGSVNGPIRTRKLSELGCWGKPYQNSVVEGRLSLEPQTPKTPTSSFMPYVNKPTPNFRKSFLGLQKSQGAEVGGMIGNGRILLVLQFEPNPADGPEAISAWENTPFDRKKAIYAKEWTVA